MSTIENPIQMESQQQQEKETVIEKPLQPQREQTQRKVGIYYKGMLTRRIPLAVVHIGGNLRSLLENVINRTFGGKCGPEGYIKPNSSKIVTYSSGILKADHVLFDIAFECLICNPVEGALIDCVAKNVTKAGIRAEVEDSQDGVESPLVIFVSRDHHFNDEYFNTIQSGDSIQVRVIGSRYKLNDPYVSVIAQLVKKPKEAVIQTEKVTRPKRKPRLVIKQ